MISHPPRRRLPRLAARWIVRLRYASLAIGVALLLVALPASRRLQMNRSITAMFDAADPALRDYRRLQQAFGGNAVAMIVYRDADLASEQGIRQQQGFGRNRLISQRVADVVGVKPQGILSPAVLSDAVKRISPPSLFGGADDPTPPLVRPDDPIAVGFDELFAGYTHSADHGLAAVVAMLDPDHPPETIGRLQQLAAALPAEYGPQISDVSLVGEPVLVHDGFQLIERDGAKLAVTTVVLLSVVVLVSLVDLRLVLLMGVIILWSITLTRALMVWADIQLSLVSTILTAIVTVIAVTAVLHLGVRFRTSRARGYSPREATERTIARLIMPILWTCATDAAGFAALHASRIVPVRQFGLMIAVAATCVLVAVALFSPAIMMLPALKFGAGLHRWQRRLAHRLRRQCLHLARACVDRGRLAVVVGLILIGIAAAGTLSVETETSFLNNFRAQSAIVLAYDDVEENFGGAGVWDVVLDAPETLSEPYLDQVRQLETTLREIDVDGQHLTKVLSVADVDQIASRSTLLKFVTPSIRLSGMKLTMPVFFDALVTAPPGERQLRIMLRSKEQLDAAQKMQLIEEVDRAVTRHTSSDAWSVAAGKSSPGRVTGYYVMMARLVSNLVGDQWRCFFVSGCLVWVLLLAATRSIRLATAALIPNLLPVLIVLACVGLAGGKINMGAAMIAAVSIGLSIDGSVHFLASYQQHRRRQHPVDTAAVHAAGNVGVPVLLATLALVIGFSVLASSEFVPTATFGVLVAATMVMGTLINLTLLPACVVTADRR
jgi:predicted RND superfamily exporter protein